MNDKKTKVAVKANGVKTKTPQVAPGVVRRQITDPQPPAPKPATATPPKKAAAPKKAGKVKAGSSNGVRDSHAGDGAVQFDGVICGTNG